MFYIFEAWAKMHWNFIDNIVYYLFLDKSHDYVALPLNHKYDHNHKHEHNERNDRLYGLSCARLEAD